LLSIKFRTIRELNQMRAAWPDVLIVWNRRRDKQTLTEWQQHGVHGGM
jgi:hypothetical protein